MKIILDLCGGSGAWSKPYLEAGYDVRLITLPQDIRLFEYPGQVHGILAAPPCRVFARCGRRWKRSEEDMVEALSVVDACLRLVTVCRPVFWALENPIGNLRRWLGEYAFSFDPCDYGDPYTKRTCLWGNFAEPVKTPVAPTEGSKMHQKLGGRQSAERAITPAGFARAFFLANP